MHMADVLLFTA